MTLLDLRDRARAHAPLVDADPALAAAAIPTWRARMINEWRSGAVFEALAEQLAAAGMDDASVSRCLGFAEEERHHGVLCGAVVEALGGEARAEIPDDAPVPSHDDVSRREAVLRNVLSVCCLSETIAVSVIGLEREQMPEGPLRELLTRIWADECGHANFGWRRLAELVPSDQVGKERVGEYLAVALAHLEEHELAHFPKTEPPPEGAALGLCSGNEARAMLQATLEQVILPGLEAHGLPARAAWARRGAVRAHLSAATRQRVRAVHEAALHH